jgi:Type II secretion system (T2SS), protein G
MRTLGLAAGFLSLALCGCSEAKTTQARMGLETVEKAVKLYHQTKSHWPKSLDELLDVPENESGGVLAASALIDPWGRPFKYDDVIRHPDTDVPLIWSDGPNPGQSGSKIANWSVNEIKDLP